MADRAVFLDRDGVINRRRPDHVKSWSEFEFLPGALGAISELCQRTERVVVVTNQSAVGRGVISSQELAAIHRRMTQAVEAAGGHIDGVYACPHRPEDGCACRKPRIGLLLAAAHELSLRLEGSVLIGDSPSDVEAARASGCRAIFVGDSLPDVGDAVPAAKDLLHAVRLC